jgi:hypothetical protein
MPAPRASTVRGTLADRAGQRRYRPQPDPPEPVADPEQPRRVVLYTLQRRAALRSLFAGEVFSGAAADNPLDAHPYLLRAAKYYGEETGRACPVCRRGELAHVHYSFSDELPGDANGSARHSAQLADLAQNYGAVTIYVVEVCGRCHWNHVVISYVIGDGNPRSKR